MIRSSRVRELLPWSLSLALTACVIAPSEPTPDAALVASDGRYVMGTVLEIELRGLEASQAERRLEELFTRVEQQNEIFSRFLPDSALSRLNAAAGAGPTPVPLELARLLEDSRAYATLTQGAFDVTVGPLVDLWTEAGRTGRLPEPAALERARGRVGAVRYLRVADGRAELAVDTRIDLGGIAKGFALDRLRPLLADVPAALLSFGGSSLFAHGAPGRSEGWRIALRGADDALVGTLTLRDQSLSVSASLGQGSEIEGRRYGHVLDPRTGWPLSERRLAAVVAPTGALAEALSKAMLVLDPDEAFATIESLDGVESVLLFPDAPPRMSSGFAARARFVPAARRSSRTLSTAGPQMSRSETSSAQRYR